MKKNPILNIAAAMRGWFDSDAYMQAKGGELSERIDWYRCLPFIGMHAACLLVFVVGWSWTAVAVAAALYFIRMFAITGFYHRYFSHRTFRASRPVQLMMAVLGNSSGQRGPIWWAAHHRHHHRHSDEEDDFHSPHQHSLLWSHMLWFTTERGFVTRSENVPDLVKWPELRWLDRFDWFVPTVLAFSMLGLGAFLGTWFPATGTNGWQMLVWGFVVSTIVLFHGTCLINSMAHLFGRQRYETGDESRNSLLLSLITLGEGWHNNHHHYPGATRQGFYWWEIDITYYGLKAMSWMHLIRDLNEVPARVLETGLVKEAAPV